MALLSTKVSPLERAPKTILELISWGSTSTSVQCIHWHGNFGVAPINCPALFCRVLPTNIGESSVVNLLLSQIKIIIEALGAFNYLGKHLLCLFSLLYDFRGVFIIYYLESGGCTLDSIYTVRLYIQQKHHHRLLWIKLSLNLCDKLFYC